MGWVLTGAPPSPLRNRLTDTCWAVGAHSRSRVPAGCTPPPRGRYRWFPGQILRFRTGLSTLPEIYGYPWCIAHPSHKFNCFYDKRVGAFFQGAGAGFPGQRTAQKSTAPVQGCAFCCVTGYPLRAAGSTGGNRPPAFPAAARGCRTPRCRPPPAPGCGHSP